MKDKKPRYATGAYGCLKEELMDVINDLDNDETKYVVSAKTDSGLTIYSFPGLQKKIKDVTYDLIDAMEQKLIFKLGTTWVNTEHIVTVRVAKYIDEEEEEEY